MENEKGHLELQIILCRFYHFHSNKFSQMNWVLVLWSQSLTLFLSIHLFGRSFARSLAHTHQGYSSCSNTMCAYKYVHVFMLFKLLKYTRYRNEWRRISYNINKIQEKQGHLQLYACQGSQLKQMFLYSIFFSVRSFVCSFGVLWLSAVDEPHFIRSYATVILDRTTSGKFISTFTLRLQYLEAHIIN